LPESSQDLARELIKPMPHGEPLIEKLLEELVRCILRLRWLRVKESMDQLRFLQEELQQQGDYTLGPYQESFLQYQQIRDRLDRALAQPMRLD
jgi:hypothetical protein